MCLLDLVHVSWPHIFGQIKDSWWVHVGYKISLFILIFVEVEVVMMHDDPISTLFNTLWNRREFIGTEKMQSTILFPGSINLLRIHLSTFHRAESIILIAVDVLSFSVCVCACVMICHSTLPFHLELIVMNPALITITVHSKKLSPTVSYSQRSSWQDLSS